MTLTNDQIRRRGLLEIFLSGVAFGFLGYFGKSLLSEGVSPFELLAVRFLGASFIMGIWIFLIQRRALRLSKNEILICLALGSMGYAVFSSLFFLALKGLPASLTVLLLYTYPVMVSIGGVLFLQERLSRGDCIAIGSVMIGLYWIVGPEWNIRDPLLIGFGLLSAMIYSIYILISRRYLKSADPYQAALLIQASAAFVVATAAFHNPHFLITTLMPKLLAHNFDVIGVVVVCTVLAMSLFLTGLPKVSSTEMALFSTTEPVVGVIVAVTLMQEGLSARQWLGGLLILSALIVVARSHRPDRRPDRRPDHQSMG